MLKGQLQFENLLPKDEQQTGKCCHLVWSWPDPCSSWELWYCKMQDFLLILERYLGQYHPSKVIRTLVSNMQLCLSVIPCLRWNDQAPYKRSLIHQPLPHLVPFFFFVNLGRTVYFTMHQLLTILILPYFCCLLLHFMVTKNTLLFPFGMQQSTNRDQGH